MIEEKTIISIGMDTKGFLQSHIDSEWLFEQLRTDPGILISIVGVLENIKNEINMELHYEKMDTLTAQSDLQDFEDNEKGGIDEIPGLNTNDWDDQDW